MATKGLTKPAVNIAAPPHHAQIKINIFVLPTLIFYFSLNVIMGHQYPHSSSDLVPQVVRDVWREDRIYLHAGSNEAAVQSQSSTLVVVSTCFNKSQQVSTIHFETTVVFESTNSLPGSFGPGATRLNNIGIEEERQKRNDVQHFINIGIFER